MKTALLGAVPPPDPRLVSRFVLDLLALPPALPLGLAVSGGPDSLALLLLAEAAFPGRIAAATVDHGLRPEARAEAETVASICESLDVPHAILTPSTPITGSFQASARSARYALLGAWAQAARLPAVATGHHLDDQAETFLARLLRGSGVAGLAGIRASGPMPKTPAADPDVLLVRPLLGWRRADLRDIIAAAGLAAHDDPSNADDRFDRARIRKALAKAEWLRPEPLASSASALADADEALTWTAARITAERLTQFGDSCVFDPADLPFELQRRAVAIIFAELFAGQGERAEAGDAPPTGGQYARLVTALTEGRTTTLAGYRCAPGERWRFELAPRRRSHRPEDDQP